MEDSYDVLVVDAGDPRNAPAGHVHNCLAQEGTPPAELVAAGTDAEQYWETRYREAEQLWSGNPNQVLVEVATRLEPGTALDLGCGDGSDAIWLAGRGWQVTSADVSATALARAAKRAAASGVGGNIDWQRHDLARTFPDGSFGLVSAQFLHSPVAFPREAVLRTAADLVALGGTLLVVGHFTPPPWADHHEPDLHFPTPDEVITALDLPARQWRTERAEVAERQATGPGGQTGAMTDCIVMVTRVA